MGEISSINIRKPTEHNITHNDRTRSPSYLLKNGGLGFEVDRTAREAKEYLQSLLEESVNNYRNRTGQKIQAKNLLWSAVVNIKDTTTMDDLKKLTDFYYKTYGWQCYQIAIHRDEGHIDKATGETVINHHAHLEFFMLDKQGLYRFKKCEFGKKKMQELQTKTAEVLGMQRGKIGSKAERLEHKQYKRYAQALEEKELEIKKLKEENVNLTKTNTYLALLLISCLKN